MKFKPLHDWALIQRLDAEETTSGGIIIPDAAREKPAEGIIIAIGPGKNRPDKKDKNKKIFEATSLKPGQRIIYARYMVTELEVDGEEITLVREEDILATVEGTNEVIVKESYPVRERADHPVAVKGRSEIAPVKSTPKTKKKVAAKKASKKTTVKRSLKKKTSKKKTSAKKSVKKKASKTKKKTTKKTKAKKNK